MYAKLKIFLVITLLLPVAAVSAYFPVNLFRVDDKHLHPEYIPGRCAQFSFSAEGAIRIEGRNDEEPANILQIWQPKQDAFSMVQGFAPTSTIGQLLTSLQGAGVTGAGNQGKFTVTGDLSLFKGIFALRYQLPHNLVIGLHLPLYHTKLCNVNWLELTGEVTAADLFLRQNLTGDNFFTNVNTLGDGLLLQGYSRTGVGDLTAMLEWFKDLPQKKALLSNVRLNARFGLSFPTGKKKDEDQLFSIPFGLDGSVGLIAGGGLDLSLRYYLQAGIDVAFLHQFSHVKKRRIKTHEDQTDLLLLQKEESIKDPGFSQRFTLYLEGHKFYKGFSLRLAYQFWKHGEDKICLLSNDFSTEVANTAEHLDDWTIHNFVFTLNHDFCGCFDEYSWVEPEFSFFYKLPFNGRRSVLAHTLGAQLTFSF